jgi:hypothetical protein
MLIYVLLGIILLLSIFSIILLYKLANNNESKDLSAINVKLEGFRNEFARIEATIKSEFFNSRTEGNQGAKNLEMICIPLSNHLVMYSPTLPGTPTRSRKTSWKAFL